jgi:hypothetical protein
MGGTTSNSNVRSGPGGGSRKDAGVSAPLRRREMAAAASGTRARQGRGRASKSVALWGNASESGPGCVAGAGRGRKCEPTE